jgi:nitrite reductase/ring-hydroxylating ferredoxin subunit
MYPNASLEKVLPLVSQQFDDFPLPDEGELVAVDVEGTAVAVAVLDGEVHAFDDTCPHAGCSLAEGELEDDSVVCPCHFSTFDLTTGRVVQGPAGSGVGVWSASFTDGTLKLESPPEDPPPSDAPAAAPTASPAPSNAGDRDITVLIEREHDSFRRQFDALKTLSEASELQQAWAGLCELLEIHASGEEAVLYPSLVRADEQTAHEAEHAVRDHNEIRHSIRAVQEHAAGSPAWWRAVRAAQEINEDHLQEEEQDVLTAFRDNVDPNRREQLGQQWLDFHSDHEQAQGLSGRDTDPHSVTEHG